MLVILEVGAQTIVLRHKKQGGIVWLQSAVIRKKTVTWDKCEFVILLIHETCFGSNQKLE